jgi:hypothetical protein
MRASRVVTRFESAVDALRSSSRRVWWTTFVLAFALSALWGLANPPFAAPDEPAHVIRAVSLDHGELIGKNASRRLLEELGGDDTNLQVRVPEVFRRVGTPCFAFERNVPATCLVVEGPSREADALTSAGRHPPAYYGVVGVASFLRDPGSGTVYLMRFITALLTAALIASAVTASRRTATPTLVVTGVLFAVTPMVLFVTGAVNPSAPEIAAAIALWVSGLILVSQSGERVDKRLVTTVGIAACVLALSRQLSPFWLGLIALAMLGCSNRASLRNLARSHWARLWALIVVASVGAQAAWVIIVKPLDASLLGRTRVDVPASEVVRNSLGASFSRYREMIGVFGWLDTPSPALTFIMWTAGIGFLVFLAVAWGRRSHVTVIVGLVAATIVVPIVLESPAYRDVGGVFWQGRYTLPLAVGIPIVAAMAVSWSEPGRTFMRRRLVLAVAAALVIAHVLAFAQNLRRYTQGYDGEIQYWKDPLWAPPLSPLLLTIAYTAAVIAFVWWVLVQSGAPARARDELPVSGEHVAVPASGN